MTFNIEKFFIDIFRPQKGEVVTFMIDLPHDDIPDNEFWRQRREMATQWRGALAGLSDKYSIVVNPIFFYAATGSGNAQLPKVGTMNGKTAEVADVLNNSSIIISMPQFSATAPLYTFAKGTKKQRICSMPGVIKDMENTGLSADYAEVSRRCKTIAPHFDKAIGAEVEFSTGHKCYFDLSADRKAHCSDGILHPDRAGTGTNLPGGEVYVVPNEAPDSKTQGELPQKFGNELVVYVVKNNRITDVEGSGPKAAEMRKKFHGDPAWQNIAEFAIGCNDKAVVRGVILEDEKAGFHWAYGRSDHLGGNVGVNDFKTTVVHNDVVYAKGCSIACKKLDMINEDGTRETLIIDGELTIS